MNSLLFFAVAAVTVFSVWLVWRLASIIKADGYGFRSSSGLPRDWAPPESQSIPYSVKPHF
jgi:hypothetical protein